MTSGVDLGCKMSSFDWKLSEMMSRVREEVGLFHNFQAVFEKVERDNYFKMFFESFQKIFEEEIGFAFQGSLIRTSEGQTGEGARAERRGAAADQHLHLQTELSIDNRSQP